MKLLEFPHSHYCEKARWALDFKGIPFQTVAILPGLHFITVRRYAPDTLVPLLLDDHTVVQGSDKIIDYLDQQYPAHLLTPADASLRNACLEIETAVDKRLGENLRRILYSRLLAYPDFIRYCFTHPMPAFKQFIFKIMYPYLRYKIDKTYVISTAKVEQARREFESDMAELEKKLSGQRYLVGEQFTRADLSVAAMLSLLAMPVEHPFPWIEIPDPQIRAFFDEYREHPVYQWVVALYQDHRMVSTSPLPSKSTP